MKRDMELIRKILFTIEKEFKPGTKDIWVLMSGLQKLQAFLLETL